MIFFVLLSINELDNWSLYKVPIRRALNIPTEKSIYHNQNNVMANIGNDDLSTLNSYLGAIKSK